MSAGFPSGAPASTQAEIVWMSRSLSDRSLAKCCTPTFLSMNHGGMSRASTFCLMARAHGRASSYVSSDIGAMLPGRWHTWQLFWKIGAMSFVNVTGAWPVADCPALIDTAAAVRISAMEAARVNRMTSSSFHRTGGRVPLRSVGQFLERVIDDPGLRQVLGIISDNGIANPLTSIGQFHRPEVLGKGGVAAVRHAVFPVITGR